MLRFRFSVSLLGFFFTLPIQIAAQTPVKPASTGSATISGRVVLKGEPARGVTVGLQGQQSGLPPNNALRAKTDENGRYRITGVVAGRYSVMALAPGYVATGNLDFGSRGKIVDVAEGENVENIDLEIRRGGVITGRITDLAGRAVADERVTLSRLDKNGKPQSVYQFNLGGHYEMFNTDDRGVYRVFGLPEGRYLVSVGYSQASGSSGATNGRRFYPRVFYPDAASEADAKAIEVAEGSESTGIDITVAEAMRTYDIYGRVVNADTEQPVAGMDILYGLMRPENNRITTSWATGERSRANGEFHLIGLLPGKYGVFAGSGFDNDTEFVSEPVVCDATEGDATGVEIRVRQGASIRGVVAIEGAIDPKSQLDLSRIGLSAYLVPAPGASLDLSRNRYVKVNADGSFQIRGLSQGRVEIVMNGQPIRGLSLARIEQNGAIQHEGIEVKSGEQVSGVRVVLLYSTLTLRGEVKLLGVTLPVGHRLYVRARRTDPSMQHSRSATVDARGQFVIESLMSGEYELAVDSIPSPGSERLDSQIGRVLRSFRQKVVVSGDNQSPIPIVIDFNRKEEER